GLRVGRWGCGGRSRARRRCRALHVISQAHSSTPPGTASLRIANSPARSSVMNGRILIGGAIAVALASLAAVGGSSPPQVEVTDFATAPRATPPVYAGAPATAPP